MSNLSARIDRILDKANTLAMRGMPGPRLDISPSEPLVSFTFDDVPETALSNGATILERYGVRGTYYLSGSLMGVREPGRVLISREGCDELKARGHEIGCHSFMHHKMRTLARSEIAADLSRNSTFLDGVDSRIGKRNFAYPYNAASFSAREIFHHRFQTCRGGGDRINRGRVNPALLYGMEIRQPESDALALTGQIDMLLAAPGWLIFFTHDIAETPTPYGCRPETFEKLVAYAVEKGCNILPVGAALDHLQGGRRG